MNNEKLIKTIVGALSIIVLLVVIVLNKKFIPPPAKIPEFIYSLPFVNALLNSTTFVLLIISLWAIKNKNILLHKKLNLIAFVLSALFLVSYVTAHFFIPETIFGDSNHNGILENNELEHVAGIRPVYLFILITHIVLAALAFPLILLSFYYGLNQKIIQHKKLVKWAYPMWLYISFTGPLVYVMLKPYYGF